ncbi:hypothetical protein [Streptomyces sp. NBC_00893]|uniref:hypothetical protein n=1 Tax=Streptomyces sp. NBC_00893 TaxID=2975862 RepID=UPI0022500D4C|nr:hypothetical protein [Streptomyces sp. NBC_00893]MCX4850300.1 hypothetical protein [Streptomyces sp. NBC_00893]
MSTGNDAIAATGGTEKPSKAPPVISSSRSRASKRVAPAHHQYVAPSSQLPSSS